jgi:hypothetical protein
MTVDVCTISTSAWLAFALGFALVGVGVGCATFLVLRWVPSDLSPTSWRNIIGCGLPVLAAILTAYLVSRSLPADPCGGAFTPDAPFLPILAVLCVAVAGLATFWTSTFRSGS